MCQLTYLQIPGNIKIKEILLSILVRMNSESGHRDGFGIFSNLEVNKRIVSASVFKNIGELVKYDSLPIIAHVRKASYTNKKLSPEFTHPFLYNDKNKDISFVLAHNGTLEPKVGKIPENHIDSSYFGELVFEKLKNNNDFPTAFEKTIKEFTGKFAFLSWCNGFFYIARGRTADLFVTDIKINNIPSGFIVNTEKSSLDLSLLLAMDLLNSTQSTKLEYSIPIAIPINEMYLIENPMGATFEESSIKLDVKIREETAYAYNRTNTTKHIPAYESDWWNENRRDGYTNYHGDKQLSLLPETTGNVIVDIKNSSNIATLLEFFGDYDVSLLEIDHMFEIIFSKGLLECGDKDINVFCNDMLPIIQEYAANKRIKVFRQLLLENKMTEREVYSKGIIPFPAFLYGPKELHEYFDKYKEVNK